MVDAHLADLAKGGMRALDMLKRTGRIGAIGFGATHVVTKKLAGRDSALCILFWMSAMQLALALAPAEPDDFRPATGSQDHRTLTTDPRENKGRRRPAVD